MKHLYAALVCSMRAHSCPIDAWEFVMIHTVTLNPAVDKTAHISRFTIDRVNKIEYMRADAAGKGINVSKVLLSLGEKSCAWCILAGETGHLIERALECAHIPTEALFVKGSTRTNLKIVDTELDTHTDINEPGPCVSNEDVDVLVEHLCARISRGDYVVLAGSLPRGLAADTYKTLVLTLKAHGALVWLDASGEALKLGCEAYPYCIKPNNYELAELCGCDPLDRPALVHAAMSLGDKGIELVVVSLGKDGALFVARGKRPFYVPACNVSVASTVGAGDSCVAALVHGFSKLWSLETIACFSQATAGATVMQEGTQAPSLALIEQLQSQVSVEYL